MNSILLLDTSYQPIRVISVERALCLLLSGNAEGVADEFVAMRSPSQTVKVPLVMRLGYAVKIPFKRAEPPCTRRGVLARDNHECQFITAAGPCKATATTIDHVHPRSKGGDKLSWTNLIGACGPHNLKKSDRSLEEMGWKLKRQPVAPKGTVRLMASRSDIPESWVPFLAV